MSGFVKIYGKILKSSVWVGQPAHLRLTWIALLVLADKHGQVFSSVPGLAQDAGVTIPEVLAALDAFLAPDPFSRTPDYDGRRIVEIDGGWRVLNHDKYREMRTETQVQNAARQAKFKAARRRKPPPTFDPVTPPVTTVTGNTSNARLCTLSSVDPLAGQDHPDPDPIPSDPAKDGSRARLPSGVFDAPVLQAQPSPPQKTFDVPEDWSPKPRHAARCAEAGMNLDDEVARFRTTHFQIAFPSTPAGVDKRFDRWLVDGKIRAETERAKAAANDAASGRATKGAVKHMPEWVYPKHAELATSLDVDLRAAAKAFAQREELHRFERRPCDLFEPFRAFLESRAAGARRAAGQ